ncbi:hypothetical protein KKI19_03430, partial [Patescibacteria group bacterium]|nr:hypothetical protein [Patescibacteria group bacterium]
AEKKDYSGILSFVVLSYLLVPFQAYASVKGFLESQEGPWFRTPKTGLITDIFTRGRFYRWISGILPGRLAPVARMSADAGRLALSPYLALATANNQFNNFQIRRRRRWKWTSKGILALLMVGVLLLNYLSFFAPNRPAFAQTQPTIEQQINIIDQEYSTSGGPVPTDNSLGIVRWTAGSYTGATVYFEAVFKGAVYQRQRTAVTLTDGTDYTVRIRYLCSYKAPDYYTYSYAYLYVVGGSAVATLTQSTGAGPGCLWSTTAIKTARLIIVQTDPTMIDDTETQIEVGNNENTTNVLASIADLTDKKIYRYTSSVWSPSPVVNFEASLKSSSYEGTPTDTGPNNPGTGVQDTTVGTIAWESYTDSFTNNGVYDGVSLAKGEISYYNKATNFSFSGIPSDATIKGIKVEINGYVSNILLDDYSVKIVKGGTVTGTDHASATDWPTTDDNTYRTYGGTTDLWGATWAVSDIQSTGFGVAISFINNKTGAPATYTGYVDHIRITVTYAPQVSETAYARLYTTGGTYVTGSEVSVNSTTWTRARTASSITLSDGTDYVVRIYTSSASATAYIANAKIILTQDAGGNGITALETVHQYINTKKSLAQTGTTAYARLAIAGGAAVSDSTVSTTSTAYDRQRTATSIFPTTNIYDTEISLDNTTYTQQDFDNYYTSTNWAAGTFTYLFEATLRTPSANNEDISTSWLVIQVSSLQIPEKVIFLIPLIIFLPKMVKWFQERKLAFETASKIAQVNLP